MCFKPTQEQADDARFRQERDREDRRLVEDSSPMVDPRPRGNGDADDGELDRSLEKLEKVLGS